MKAVFLIVIITAAIALFEIPPLISQKSGKELWVFIGLLAFVFMLGLMQALKVDLPNPFDWLTFIFNPITKLMQQVLE